MKLEKLTSEQEAKMLDVKQFWLDYINSCKNNQTNKNAAKIGIDWMYQLAGKNSPIIVYVDSPIGCQLAVTYLKEFVKQYPMIGKTASVRASVGDSVRASVWDSVRASVRASVWDSVRASVRASVWDSVGDSVRDSVGDSVRASVGDSVRASVRASKFQRNDFGYYANIGDYGWVSFFDFFTQIGVINDKKFNQFKEILLSGIYDTIQLEGFCIVSSLPKKLTRDDKDKLHCNDGCAVEFNDGYKLSFWHGISVPDWWILTPDKITKETIINEQNVEKRRCLMEILGETKYAELLDLIELDSYDYNGRQVILLKTKTKDNLVEDYIYFIKVICPSTDRKYYLCIPPNEEKDAISALAWTFGMQSNEYKLLIET